MKLFWRLSKCLQTRGQDPPPPPLMSPSWNLPVEHPFMVGAHNQTYSSRPIQGVHAERLARRLGSESLVTRLFLSLVRPSLEYAAPAWDSCSKHDAIYLERVHLSVARAILRISRRSCHNTDVLRKIPCHPLLSLVLLNVHSNTL